MSSWPLAAPQLAQFRQDSDAITQSSQEDQLPAKRVTLGFLVLPGTLSCDMYPAASLLESMLISDGVSDGYSGIGIHSMGLRKLG